MAFACQSGIGEEMMVWLDLALGILALALVAWARLVAIHEHDSLHSALSESITKLQERLDTDVIRLQNDIGVATSKLAEVVVQLGLSRGDLDQQVEAAKQQANELRQLWVRADAHFLTADADAVEGSRLVAELERYAVVSLEQQATGSRPRIFRGGLYAQRPVRELVPGVLDGFLTALNAGLMYRQADPPDGSRFYVRWPGDLPSADILLDTLLRAASVAAKPGERPGTTKLRTLLHTLQGGSTGFLFVGPLVIERQPTHLLAGIAPGGWAGPTDDQKKHALSGNKPPLIDQICGSKVLDWPTELTA
jgi:hypothetical protein